MLKFGIAINIHLAGMDICDRIRKAAELGYDGVDVLGDKASYDAEELRKTAEECGIDILSVNLENAFENMLNLSYDRIRPEVEETLDFAVRAGAKSITMLGGRTLNRYDAPKNIIIENLKKLSSLAEEKGIVLMIEPVNNTLNHQDMYLSSSALAFEICKTVDSPYVKVLYDFYHMQVNEGNLLHNLLSNLEWVEQLHIQGIPKFDEPFHSEVNYPYVLYKLEEAGFKKYACLEYVPTYDDLASMQDSLAYLKSYKKYATEKY